MFLQWGKMQNSKNPTTFQVIQTSIDFCLTCVRFNLIVHMKTMWFITFPTKHPICKTSLRLNRCLIKVKTKALQVCLSEFCNHSRLLFIALHFQVIKINPRQLQLHLLAAGSFTDNHFQEHNFLTAHIYRRLTFSVSIIQSEEKQRNSIGLLTKSKLFSNCETYAQF